MDLNGGYFYFHRYDTILHQSISIFLFCLGNFYFCLNCSFIYLFVKFCVNVLYSTWSILFIVLTWHLCYAHHVLQSHIKMDHWRLFLSWKKIVTVLHLYIWSLQGGCKSYQIKIWWPFINLIFSLVWCHHFFKQDFPNWHRK